MPSMNIASMTAMLRLNAKGFNRGLTDTQKRMRSFQKGIGALKTQLGGLLAVGAVTSLVKDSVELAAKAEGVNAAFKKLDQPGLLSQLRSATRGTVDDLTLMQKAVQANNFKIPIDQLATYFKFATNRAIETGESVDYLVDSIITGIGRKSVLVMDNLGISAVELQEETKRLGDFGAAAGAIIERELAKAGDVADTLATEMARSNAEIKNAKTELGNALAPAVAEFANETAATAKVWASNYTFLQKIAATTEDVLHDWGLARLGFNDINYYAEQLNKETQKVDGNAKNLIPTLDNLEGKAKAIATAFQAVNDDFEGLEGKSRGVASAFAALDKYNKKAPPPVDPGVNTGSIKAMKDELEELKDQRENADINEYNRYTQRIEKLEYEISLIENKTKALRELDRHQESVNKNIDITATPDTSFKMDENLFSFGFDMPEEQFNEDVFYNHIAAIQETRQAYLDLGAAIMYSFGIGANSLEDYGKTLVKTVRQIISAQAAEAISTAIISALSASKALGPIGLALIPVLVGGAIGMVNSALNQIPAFAEGGIVSGPTLGLMGEYPGASGNPEVIAPLNKLKDMIQPMGGEVTFRIGDRELIGVLSKANKRFSTY